MTINGPAPIILAMYVAAAKRRFGPGVVPKLRGTIQADMLKEVRRRTKCIFPVDASLRLLWRHGRVHDRATCRAGIRFPISGYHIGEAGATPVQQAAYTLSNGFAYVELFRRAGSMRTTSGHGCRSSSTAGSTSNTSCSPASAAIWAIGMRDVFGAGRPAQRFKVHTQTSGRSLVAGEFKNNLTRTAIELMLSYINGTNSCHSNSADEPFTTPSEEYVRLAAHAQAILLEESGLFKHTMNLLAGSPGMRRSSARSSARSSRNSARSTRSAA